MLSTNTMMGLDTNRRLPSRFLLGAAAAPPLVFEFLAHGAPHLDPVFLWPQGRFFVGSGLALTATLVSVTLATTGLRHRNAQLFFLGTAFLTLAVRLILDAFATAGLLATASGLPNPQQATDSGSSSLHGSPVDLGPKLLTLAGQAGFTLTAACLAIPLVTPFAGYREQIGAPTGGAMWRSVTALVVMGGLLWNPDGIYDALFSSSVLWAVGALTALAFAASACGYWRAYATSHAPLQQATAYAAAWLAAAQWIALLGSMWHLSWWLHHALQAGAVFVVLVGVIREYAQPKVWESWPKPPFGELEALVPAAITETIRALVAAIELRDPHTAAHSQRVALAALHLGQAMGLPRHALRALVRGALVHDVGKLEVPEAILNKPGPLTPEERRLLERHPVAGYELCARLGLLPEERAIVRHHHERWDGTGYPDRFQGHQIPLLARVVAVVDVYDALTSDRVDRPGWTPARAQAYVRQNAGTQFDPAVVDLWLRLVASKPPT